MPSQNDANLTIPQLKAKVISQLHENSHDLGEFVEAWKQESRNKKHQVYQARHNLMSELEAFERKPANLDLSNKSDEELKKMAMEEIRNKRRVKSKSGGDFSIIEEWRQKVIEKKVEILANRNQVLSQIRGKRSKITKMLNPIEKKKASTETEQKSALLADIRKTVTEANQKSKKSNLEIDVIPAWKEHQNNQKRNTFENKRNVLSELSTVDKKELLQTVCDILTIRAKFLDSIRNLDKEQEVVESWKQENRNQISNPMILKQQMMNSILTENNKLKSTQEPRTAILEAIAAKNDDELEMKEDWKVKNNKQRTEALKNKHNIVCDIIEKKGEKCLNKEANRENMLEQVRNVALQKCPNGKNIPTVEAWKQSIRNEKSNLIMAKKRVLIDVETPAKACKVLKPLEKSDLERHTELMNDLRTQAVLPSWKVNVNNERISTIQNKNKISNEILENKFLNINLLKNVNTVQDNKVNLMKDVRSKFGNQLEAWKETEKEVRAVTIGNKNVVHEDILSKTKETTLKQTKNQTELKSDALKELRMKADMSVPKWKEDLLDEQCKIKGNRNEMICEIREMGDSKLNNKNLVKTLSFNEQKSKCLSEIRRCNPIPAWKEEINNEKAEFYSARRGVNFDISQGKFNLENCKSQSELRQDCLRQIRLLNTERVTPVWKEAKLEKRAKVFTNKQMLNRAIENLNI